MVVLVDYPHHTVVLVLLLIFTFTCAILFVFFMRWFSIVFAFALRGTFWFVCFFWLRFLLLLLLTLWLLTISLLRLRFLFIFFLISLLFLIFRFLSLLDSLSPFAFHQLSFFLLFGINFSILGFILWFLYLIVYFYFI